MQEKLENIKPKFVIALGKNLTRSTMIQMIWIVSTSTKPLNTKICNAKTSSNI